MICLGVIGLGVFIAVQFWNDSVFIKENNPISKNSISGDRSYMRIEKENSTFCTRC